MRSSGALGAGRGGGDEGAGGGFREAAVGVGLGGVEVGAVAGVEDVFFLFIVDGEAAFEDEDKFGSVVEVFGGVLAAAFGEFGEVGLERFVLGGEGEVLEKVGRFDGVGTVREADALGGANDGEELAVFLIAEEMVEADVEDHGDAGEGGKRGDELAVFELAQKGGGEAGVFAEIDKGDFFAEAELAEFLADLVGGEDAADGFGAIFRHTGIQFSTRYILASYFIRAEMTFSRGWRGGRSPVKVGHEGCL